MPRGSYISDLQKSDQHRKAVITDSLEIIQEFRVFLQSPKFQGIDTDGTTKDWISTSDVEEWLRSIRSKLLEGQD